jgi:2-oxoglutarate ferredoxin oxidoreductase subunit alpha
MAVDINFMVGGEAGQGVQSAGYLIAKTLARSGYHVFADQDYESRIRGGHSFFRIRAGDMPVGAPIETVNILIALNKETIDLHREALTEKGVIVYDSDAIENAGDGAALFAVPLQKLAEGQGGNKIMSNAVAVGVALAITGVDFERLAAVLDEYFGEKSGGANVKVARAGYDYAKDNFKNDTGFKLNPIGDSDRMLISGNDAISVGAIAAGCKFYAGYPMTPSTPIMEYLAAKSKEYGIAVIQSEDEIAAINMVVGASFAGVRAMTATSGSGFALMVEGLGLAGMAEIPVVIVDGMRAGPAVGLPTRTEQGDLLFVTYAGNGDFPRAVLAPADVSDCFWLTIKAFNLAERYQTPVIILNDHYLASCYQTVDMFDASKVEIDRGVMFEPDGQGSEKNYLRYRVTDSGISPRAFPGLSRALVRADVDEHTELGFITEDADVRTDQVDKRMRKLVPMKAEVIKPRSYGQKKADTLLIGWGSTYGALHEVVDTLERDKVDARMLHLNQTWPFPAQAVADAIEGASKVYVVENNASGQLAQLIQAETGANIDGHILKYDGRPFMPSEIAQVLKKEVC